MRTIAVLMGCLCVCMTSVAWAGPSPFGLMGNINTPSADVLRPGQFGVGFYAVEGGSLAMAAVSPVSGLELGVASLPENSGRDSGMRLDIKTTLLSEAILLPGVVLGLEDVTNERETSPYLAMSKTGPWGFRLHAGVGGGRFNGAFATLEKTFRPSRHPYAKQFAPTTLLMEYDGQHMNYGLRVEVNKGVKIEGGRQHDKWYAGLSVLH